MLVHDIGWPPSRPYFRTVAELVALVLSIQGLSPELLNVLCYTKVEKRTSFRNEIAPLQLSYSFTPKLERDLDTEGVLFGRCQERMGALKRFHFSPTTKERVSFSNLCSHLTGLYRYRRVSHGLGWPANAILFLPIVNVTGTLKHVKSSVARYHRTAPQSF